MCGDWKRRWGCCLSPVVINLQRSKDANELFEDFNTVGQVICTVKYGDEEQTVLQGASGRLIEFGKFCELENSVEKSEITSISIQPSPVRIMTNQKRPENVWCFRYLQIVEKLHLKVNP